MATTAKPLAALACALVGALAGAAAFLTVSAGPAQALPAFARQTGHPCADCHTMFPELRPFGRRFKIGGYTMGGGDWQGPPIAAFYQGGFTNGSALRLHGGGLRRADARGTLPPRRRTARRRACTRTTTLTSQQISGFIAGKPSSGESRHIHRRRGRPGRRGPPGSISPTFATPTPWTLFGKDTIWGIDVNNSPSIEDPWNTTPSWSWPQISLDDRAGLRAAADPHRVRLRDPPSAAPASTPSGTTWCTRRCLAYKGLPVPVMQALQRRQRDHRRAHQPRALLGVSRSSRIGAPTT